MKVTKELLAATEWLALLKRIWKVQVQISTHKPVIQTERFSWFSSVFPDRCWDITVI